LGVETDIRRPLLADDSTTGRRTTAVSVALFATAAISAAQALILTGILGEGAETDAFLGIYTLYLGVVLLASTMRVRLIPLFGPAESEPVFRKRATEMCGRATLIGLVLSGGLLAATPVIAPVVTQGLPSDAQSEAVLALCVLAPAAALQFRAAALSAMLAGSRRFGRSSLLYIVGGVSALAVSALMLTAIGLVGAAVGVLCGSIVIVVGHEWHLRGFGVRVGLAWGWLRERQQWVLGVTLVGYASMSQVQQLNVAVAATFLSSESGQITIYTYAFMLVGVVLNVTSVALGFVLLPNLVRALERDGPGAVTQQLVQVCTFGSLFFAPVLAALVVYGEPLLGLLLGPFLSDASIMLLHEVSSILCAYAVATAVLQSLVFALVALGRWRITLALAAFWFGLQVVLVASLGHLGITWVAVAHVIAVWLTAGVMLAVVCREDTVEAMSGLVRAIVPALVFAGLAMSPGYISGLQGSAAIAAVGVASGLVLYSALVRVFRPTVAEAVVRGWRRRAIDRVP
jgi:putative peptidoglycan lipid II flippase